MENLKSKFNNKIVNMSNYIMFEIKAKQNELTPMLKAKDRAPIALSMGAPVEKVPEYIVEKKEINYVYTTIHAIIDGSYLICAISCYGIKLGVGR